jgi:hypothetical protein
VRLHVVDFRLEFDLPRFHPLKRLDIPSNFSSVVILNNATVVPKMDNKRNQATPPIAGSNPVSSARTFSNGQTFKYGPRVLKASR